MNKNINSRNTMNDKINDFITPNFLNKNNNNNNESFQDTRIIYDKNNFITRFFKDIKYLIKCCSLNK